MPQEFIQLDKAELLRFCLNICSWINMWCIVLETGKSAEHSTVEHHCSGKGQLCLCSAKLEETCPHSYLLRKVALTCTPLYFQAQWLVWHTNQHLNTPSMHVVFMGLVKLLSQKLRSHASLSTFEMSNFFWLKVKPYKAK